MDFFKNNPYICCSMRQKVILFAALLLLTIPVHAQWVVGGSFSFRTSASNKTNDIVFRPDVSYSFGKVSVGATLTVDCYNFYDQHRTDWSLGITPYVQYYLWSSGVLSFFWKEASPTIALSIRIIRPIVLRPMCRPAWRFPLRITGR